MVCRVTSLFLMAALSSVHHSSLHALPSSSPLAVVVIEARAQAALQRSQHHPERQDEAHFLLGSAYCRLADKQVLFEIGDRLSGFGPRRNNR